MINQTHLVDLTDQELLEYLGFCYEEIKGLEERLKADPEILELEQQLKDLKMEKYSGKIREHKAMLRAARSLAKAKGLKFSVPEKIYEQEDY